MQIDRSGVVESPYVRLDSIEEGETFRLPEDKNCVTVWMVTANKSKNPQRAAQIRTVSLMRGSTAYKEPSLRVVRVSGKFVVTDWGQG